MNPVRRSPPALCIAVALCISAGFAGTQARSETLADALVAAYGNSNLLEQNRALLRVADEDVPQALGGLRPVLAFVASASHRYQDPPETRIFFEERKYENEEECIFIDPDEDEGVCTVIIVREKPITNERRIGLTLDLVLLDSGRTRHAAEAARETVLATREALRQVEQRVLLQAVAAYMDVIRSAEFESLHERNVQLIERELRAAEDRFDVGAVTRTDVALAEARLARAQARLTAAQGDLKTARESYRTAIGHYPGNLVRPSSPPRTPVATEEEAKDVAQRSHPLILQARNEAAAAEALVKRAKATMKPTLTARAALTHVQELQPHSDDRGETSEDHSLEYLFRKAYITRDEKTASLNLEIPIYSGGRRSSALREAIARRDAARSALLQNALNVGESVGRSWSNIRVADARIVAGERQVEAALSAFEGVREETALGSRTTLDVLDAEQDLLNANAALIEAETQRHVGAYSLMASMGLMTAEHLNLGIATYDPAAYYDAVRRGTLRKVSPDGEKLEYVLMRLFRDEKRDEAPQE